VRPSRWVHPSAAALAARSLVLWYATGAEGFTRWPNERLANADAAPVAGELDLLADVGFSDIGEDSTRPDIQSRFAFGLVPGGFDPAHLIAVATVAGAVLAASMATVAFGRCANYGAAHSKEGLAP